MTLTPLPPDLDAIPMGMVRLSAAARLAGITPSCLKSALPMEASP